MQRCGGDQPEIERARLVETILDYIVILASVPEGNGRAGANAGQDLRRVPEEGDIRSARYLLKLPRRSPGSPADQIRPERLNQYTPQLCTLRRDLLFSGSGRQPVLDRPRFVLQVERQFLTLAVVHVLHHQDRFVSQSAQSIPVLDRDVRIDQLLLSAAAVFGCRA